MIQSSLLFETVEEIYGRVYRELRPRAPLPAFAVEYRPFANVNSFIRSHNGHIQVRMSDLLEGAPAPVQEALAHILLGKLYRKPIADRYQHRYRLFLNRTDIRRKMLLLRQLRGRKQVSGSQGECYNLEEIFEDLNRRFFDGLLARPDLSWSRTRRCVHTRDFKEAERAFPRLGEARALLKTL